MTDATLDQARQSIAVGSKSFSMASRFLPPGMHDDCVMLYAWCRHADDMIDGQEAGFSAGAAHDPAARLRELRDLTHRALRGEASAPVYAGLARVMAARAIPHRHVDELLDGFAMDVDGRVYNGLNDLLDYCYHVAGVVGVMMARIMGVRDESVLDRASDLGLAFQLTNVARDVIDDARIGRTYLPRDLLASQGIAAVDPDDLSQRPALHRVALHLLDQAEIYYRSADAGIAALPRRPALAIAAARNIYRQIGVKLRDQGPDAWNGRLTTTRGEKLRLAAQAAAGTVLSPRRRVSAVPRDGLYRRP
ncbi:phytoene/squalene synthase family protein [Paracoccus sediminis]|uniref:Phytoene synthase n=1 Tax=Paracoccus sediminis TaxID=1214787 RepID=A0A238WF06_9RHOB|nr:phytoene/squalene synthase family protein [Paracoccus sediminis]TBN50885.1 phytoene/squalene synthase family protein [Paracoccus sediminis]SNR45145.1 phytoene synthase [Paracoccus sediminis]